MRRLAGHGAEVISLAWCPTSNLLASASSDGTARIWDLQDSGASGSGRVCVCRHAPQGGEPAVDLTCVEWAPDGQALATGATDSAVRLFSREGALRCAGVWLAPGTEAGGAAGAWGALLGPPTNQRYQPN